MVKLIFKIVEDQNYKKEESDPVIDLGYYNFEQNELTEKINNQGFSVTLFWSRLSAKDKLYTTIGLIIFIILIILFFSFLKNQNSKRLPVTPAQYSAPVNYTPQIKYTPPLP